MRLAASDEVVGRIATQAPQAQAPVASDAVDQLHGRLADFIRKGFTPEAAAQLTARHSHSSRHQ